jgi:hypothetical protein
MTDFRVTRYECHAAGESSFRQALHLDTSLVPVTKFQYVTIT